MKKSIQEVIFIFLGIPEIFCPFSFGCEERLENPLFKLKLSILT
jgi:hypothetical protein